MKKIGFILLLCFAMSISSSAQICQTEGNRIREISVNANGEPVITWNKPTDLPSNANGYIIYDYKGTLPNCTEEITRTSNFNDTSYIDTRNLPLTKTRSYCIAISTTLEPEPITQQHAFSFLQATYDSCRYSIAMSWTPYIGWGEGVTYKIYGGIVGGAISLLDKNRKDTTYTIPDTPDNVNYVVYVEAVNTNDTAIKSISNRVVLKTTTSQRPKFMCIDTIMYNYVDKKVNLQFSIDTNTQLSIFYITRSEQTNGVFDTIYIFSDKTLNIYTDQPVEKIYYYRITAENHCGLNAPVKNNPILNNILLSQKAENGTWHLKWSPLYDDNPQYNLTRLQPNPVALLSFSPATLFDDVINISEPELTYCYRVEAIAIEKDSAKSITEQCATYTPEVLMPNAIDPKSTVMGTALNSNIETRARNEFGPVVYAPSSTYQYQLEIYGKNSDRIASITKTEADLAKYKSWTGLLRDGSYAPEGMYIYRLKITFTNGQSLTKTGSVAVVYN